MATVTHPTTKPDDVDPDGASATGDTDHEGIGIDHPTVVPTNFDPDE